MQDDHFLLLKQKLKLKNAELNYWRTKDKAEVDFVIEAGNRLIPIEVKFKRFKKLSVPASLHSFIDKYRPESAYVVNLDYSETIQLGSTRLSFLPYHKLLRQDIIM